MLRVRIHPLLSIQENCGTSGQRDCMGTAMETTGEFPNQFGRRRIEAKCPSDDAEIWSHRTASAVDARWGADCRDVEAGWADGCIEGQARKCGAGGEYLHAGRILLHSELCVSDALPQKTFSDPFLIARFRFGMRFRLGIAARCLICDQNRACCSARKWPTDQSSHVVLCPVAMDRHTARNRPAF